MSNRCWRLANDSHISEKKTKTLVLQQIKCDDDDRAVRACFNGTARDRGRRGLAIADIISR